MKFGKQFELYKIPEWFEYYFDYEGIKLILNFLVVRAIKMKKLKSLQMVKKMYQRKYTLNQDKLDKLRRRGSVGTIETPNTTEIPVNTSDVKKFELKKKRILEAEDLSYLPNDQKLSKFLVIYKDKIKLRDDFFKQKLEEYIAELNKLENKMSMMDNHSNDESFVEEMNAERDEMGYAVSWKRALSSLYNETSWLHSYHSINSLAVQKIQKKIIKIFRLYGIEIGQELDEIKTEYSFFGESLNRLVDLRVRINKLYSEKFTKGNDLKANKELEKRLQGGAQENKCHLLCLYLGIFILGIDMLVLQHYKINYVYIFELDTRNKVKPFIIFQNALGLSALWILFFLLMKMAMKFNLFGGEYTLFPLIMNTLLVVILFLPFHIIYLSFRKGLLLVLIRNLFPFGKNTVRFKDFVFGDILTSLSDPFKNLLLGYCLMV